MDIEPRCLTCPQCGAPLEIESGHRVATCSYCGSRLYTSELSGRSVTRAESSRDSIGDGTQSPDTVMAQPVLSQSERDHAYVRLQLTSVGAEIESLEHQPQTDATRQQLDSLRAQERTLKARLRYWQANGTPSAADAPPAHADKVFGSGCVGGLGCLIAIALIVGMIVCDGLEDSLPKIAVLILVIFLSYYFESD